jgi:cobalt-zinc-cadmium efflux system outer membrane protein
VTRAWLSYGIALLPFAASCTPAPQDAGFGGVQETVSGRARKNIQWNRGTEEDEQVRQAVAAMLAQDITVDQAVQIALLNNRHLQSTYELLGVAQADLVQAGLFKNPIFTIGYGFVEGDGFTVAPDDATNGDATTLARRSSVPLHTPHIPPPVPGGGGAVGGAGGVTGSEGIFLGAAFDFLDLFYAPLRTRIAAEGLEEAKALVAAEVLKLAGRVRVAFFELQAAQQRLELRQTHFKASELSYQMSQRIHRAGNMTDLDLAMERARYERARSELADAQAEITAHRERLNRLMGLWGEQTVWRSAGALPEPPAEEIPLERLESQAVAQSLQLEAIRRQIYGVSRALGLSKATNLVPELGVGVGVSRTDGVWSGGPSLSVPIPLFDWGQARTASLLAELRREQQRYIAVAVDLRSEVREARAMLIAAREQEAFYRRGILPLQSQIVDLAQDQYNAMQTDPLQLLQAKQQEIESRVDYLERLLEYWERKTELEQLLIGAGRMQWNHHN